MPVCVLLQVRRHILALRNADGVPPDPRSRSLLLKAATSLCDFCKEVHSLVDTVEICMREGVLTVLLPLLQLGAPNALALIPASSPALLHHA